MSVPKELFTSMIARLPPHISRVRVPAREDGAAPGGRGGPPGRRHASY